MAGTGDNIKTHNRLASLQSNRRQNNVESQRSLKQLHRKKSSNSGKGIQLGQTNKLKRAYETLQSNQEADSLPKQAKQH